MIDGSDGGASVTLNGGDSWSTLDNQPTADLFSLAIDNQDPYWCLRRAERQLAHRGAEPDQRRRASRGRTTSRSAAAKAGRRRSSPTAASSTPAIARPSVRYDRRDAGDSANISVWPEDQFGAPPKDVKYRFYYSFPTYCCRPTIRTSSTPARSTSSARPTKASRGRRSARISRATVMDKMQKIPGGPITSLASSLFYVSLIRTIAESPLEKGELWIGTDDSTVQVSQRRREDVGERLAEGLAGVDDDHRDRRVAARSPGRPTSPRNRVRVSDRAPYLYKTTDYGRTWQKITNGIRENDFAYVIREDPVRHGLLFAGTETGAYVSFDAGATWQSLQRNLPPVAVAYMQVKNDDLVVATHGRGFWIMDNIAALRQITPEVTSAAACICSTSRRPTRRGGRGGGWRARGRAARRAVRQRRRRWSWPSRTWQARTVRHDATTSLGGPNPPAGVLIEYYLKQAPSGEVTLTFLDATGQGDPAVLEPGEGRAPHAGRAGDEPVLLGHALSGRARGALAAAARVVRGLAPRGSVAPPGRYTVRLEIGGQAWSGSSRFAAIRGARSRMPICRPSSTCW